MTRILLVLLALSCGGGGRSVKGPDDDGGVAMDRFARMPALVEEGEPLARARYELRFGDKVYGEERLILSRLPDGPGTLVVHGQQSADFPAKSTTTFRATMRSGTS